MRAMRFHEHGGPEVFRADEVPLPEPGPGQARVKLEAVGVNFIDIYHRMGTYKVALPFTPGQEGAGVVDALGAGVTGLRLGERVAYAFSGGAYAEYTLVPADKLVPVPDGVSSAFAAAVMLQGTTAHYLATDTFALGPGHTALIHAAAGGTGNLLVQMAKLRGARVIATASTEAKRALATAAGADAVLPYEDFDTATRALTLGAGVDVVYDSVGRDTFDRSLNCLRPRGVLALFGHASGTVSPVDPLTLMSKGSLYLTRPTLGNYLQTREELLRRAGDVLGWLGSGAVKARIDRSLPLSEAGAAQAALAGRATTGKVVLIP
ncbi:MAG: quinone oxidoreductase [Anaerolineae bacterium]|nr:quinone oxidoreductase [Anaerolineae bacterium]